jgi:protein ImuB
VVPAGDITKEIDLLTTQLTRFTPKVEPSYEEPGVFWLSGLGLRLLYPSLQRWASTIATGIEARGFSISIVVGFTRFGTYAAAKKTRRGVTVFADSSEERAATKEVPLSCLGLDPKIRLMLFKLGIKTVGAMLSLPPGGLHERFGAEVHRLHRMASGDLWTPLQPSAPEDPVRQKLLLDDPETDAARLLFLVKRLLHPMLTTLAARGEAIAELWLRLLIDRSGWQEERIRPAAPTLNSVQVLDLVRLRLESVEFSAGVMEIGLTAGASPATQEQLKFFADQPGRDLNAANRALARVRAEFGDDAVVRAKLTYGHLPEARFIWEPLEHVKLPELKHEGAGVSSPSATTIPSSALVSSKDERKGFQQPLVRRILAKPIPLPLQPRMRDDGWLILGPKHGAVERFSGPYVLSGGWWNREIHREYYFAETRRGDLLWVYYDRPRRKWFLQGWVE